MTIIYNAKDHFNVVFSLHGSVWPSVFPFCIFNCAIVAMVFYFRSHSIVDLTFDGGLGYQYISVLVSFFVVMNVNTTYARYWEARGALGKALNTMAMLATRAALYTSNDHSPGAREWRKLLKLRLIELIDTTMFMIQNERGSLINLMGPDTDPGTNSSTFEKHGLKVSSYQSAMSKRMANEREPFPLRVMLEAIVFNNGKYLKKPLTEKPMEDLMGRCSQYMDHWQDLLKFSTTPRPFVLVQMGRTIIFAFVLSLPFVLTPEDKALIECLLEVFLVTYGFMGLMLAEVELHDPLGDEANNLETSRYTAIITSDIDFYLDNDGWVQRLKSLAFNSDAVAAPEVAPPNYGSTNAWQQETNIGMEHQAHAEAIHIYGNRRFSTFNSATSDQ